MMPMPFAVTQPIPADFNLDGKLDLLAVFQTRAVKVLFGGGDGTFQLGVTFGPGTVLAAVVTVVFAGYGGLYLMPGNGDGTFQLPILTTTAMMRASRART
jgi:hypothetical protein